LLNLLPESGFADDLVTVVPTNPSGVSPTSDLLMLHGVQDGNTITVKHTPATTNGFELQGGKDFAIGVNGEHLLCLFNNNAVPPVWQEIARFPRKASDLAGSDEAIYTPITIHLAGTPAIAIDKQVVILNADYTIKSATMYAVTAPSTGDAVVDILIDGTSMFADQSEMPHVLSGANSDVSTIKNKAVTAGQRIQLEAELINGAADVSVTLHCYMKPQVPPT